LILKCLNWIVSLCLISASPLKAPVCEGSEVSRKAWGTVALEKPLFGGRADGDLAFFQPIGLGRQRRFTSRFLSLGPACWRKWRPATDALSWLWLAEWRGRLPAKGDRAVVPVINIPFLWFTATQTQAEMKTIKEKQTAVAYVIMKTNKGDLGWFVRSSREF
jgi:hypothetical protein